MSVSALVKQLLTTEAAEEGDTAGDELNAKSEFLALAAELRALSESRTHTPSEILQRESRDER